MSSGVLIEVLVVNAVFATALALLAVSVRRWVRRPAAVHFVWLLVLARLLAPPVVELALLPSAAAPLRAEAGAPATDALPVAPDEVAAGAAPEPRATQAVGARAASVLPRLWFGGALLVLLAVSTRAFRFAASVQRRGRRSPRLDRRVAKLAHGMRVTPPPVRVVSLRISPMIWGRTLLWPAGLTSHLSPAETDAVLAHELGHLYRRDHWVRLPELAALVLFWWHPVMWWARRNLRRAEEEACDAKVLETMPDRARAYARGLVKTLEFLAIRGAGTPAMATGALSAGEMKKRLSMILDHDRRQRRRAPFHRVLGVAALGVLLIAPTWAERKPSTDDEGDRRQQIAALERQIVDLQRQIETLQERHDELRGGRRIDGEVQEPRVAADRARALEERLRLEEMDRSRVRALGQDDMRRRSEELERELREQAELGEQARRGEDERFAREAEERTRELERELRERTLEWEEARLEADDRLARDAEKRRRALEHEMERLHREMQEQQQQLGSLEIDLKRAHEKLASLREAGRTDEARALDAQIRELEAELDRRSGGNGHTR